MAGAQAFNQVTTIHFTDGQSFYDIVKLRNKFNLESSTEYLSVSPALHCSDPPAQ
jgi:hypothetical protein